MGDSSEQKAFKYTGITCFNPGSFANDSTFVVYRPCNQEVELSALDTWEHNNNCAIIVLLKFEV